MFGTFKQLGSLGEFLNTDIGELLQRNKETPYQYAPNSPEEKLAITKRYYEEILNQGKLDVIDELMSPDFLFTIPTHPDPYRGPEGFKQLILMLHGAFPDVHLEIQHLLVDGDTVVGHWIGSANHTGQQPLHTVQGDLPATGKHFVIDGVSWLKIVDGKIVESLANEDTLSLLLQLGVIPSKQPSPKEIVDRYFNEILNQGNLATIDEIIAADCILHVPVLPSAVKGYEHFKQFASMMRRAFPDLHYEVQYEANSGDLAARRWIFRGTHQGDFLGHAPTGKTIEYQGVHIFQLEGNRIKEVWINQHSLGLLEQLGAMGAPEANKEETSE